MNSLKVLYSTDWHITTKNPNSREDIYPITILRKINEITSIIKNEKPDLFLIGGDLFHTPKISLKFAGIVAEIMRHWNVPIYVVPGNHDTFSKNSSDIGQTMLGMFEKTGIVKLLLKDNPIYYDIDGCKLSIEGSEYNTNIDIDKNSYQVISNNDSYNVLIIHSMLLDKPFIDTVDYTLIDDVKTNANMILAGHYHSGWKERIVNNTHFINPGSLLRCSLEKRDKVGLVSITFKNTNGSIQPTVKNIYLKSAKKAKEIFDFKKHKERKENDKVIDKYKKTISEITDNKYNFDVHKVLENIFVKMNIDNKIKKLCIKTVSDSENEIEMKQNYYDGYIEKPYDVWIKKLELTNFQSHEHSIINFKKGMNVIIGETNSGKTSILRGLLWCLYGEPEGNSFIRTGANSCSVKIFLSDGDTIERNRTEKSAGNWIITKSDGTVIEKTKFGRSIPIEVLNAHNMPKINLADNSMYVNVSRQLDKPFLISDTSGIKTQKINKLINMDAIDYSIKKITSKNLKNNNSIKIYEDILKTKEKDLKQYDDLKIIENKMNKANNIVSTITQIEKNIADVNRIYNSINSYTNNIKQIDKQIIKYEKIQTDKQIYSLKQNLLQIEKINAINNLIMKYDYSIKNINNNLNNLNSKNLIDIDKAKNLLFNLESLYNKYMKVNKCNNVINTIDNNVVNINTILDKYNNAYFKNNNIINKVKKQFKSYLLKINYCPLCGSKVDEKHIDNITNS